MDNIIDFLRSKDFHVSEGTNTQTFFAFKHTEDISHTTISFVKSKLTMNYSSISNTQTHKRSLVSQNLQEIYEAIQDFIKLADAEDMLELFMIT